MREPCPTQEGKPLDTFQQIEILALAFSDLHEARAQELEALGFHRPADRIRKCSQSSGPFSRRTCKVRLCPTCSQRLAAKHKSTARQAIAKMAKPVQVIFSLDSLPEKSRVRCPFPDWQRHPDDGSLYSTWTRFRKLFARFRRRACLAGVTSAIGGLEPKVSNNGDGWVVHAHLVLDVEVLDEEVVAREWKRLTKGLGTFKFYEGDPKVGRGNLDSVAHYITKSRDWSPMPGTLTLAELSDLLTGICGRQVLVEWKTGRRGRKRRKTQ